MPFCTKCGTEVSGPADTCAKCGVPLAQPQPLPAFEDSLAARILLPVGRSGWAIASGYLGLFSLLGFFAPFALVTGFLALRDIKRHPEKHGAGRAWFGIIMGGLGSLVFTVILLIAMFSKN